MNDEITRKYMEYRREHTFVPARYALSWAKSGDASEEWEEQNYDRWTREVDGFRIELTTDDESIFPIPDKHGNTDYGKYVDDRGSHWGWEGEWNGNWAEPDEQAGVQLIEDTPSGKRVRDYQIPYTAIHYSGPGWTQGETDGYFIPDGIQDQFEFLRRHGQSRSVALDLTIQFVEEQLTMLFSSPLTNTTVWVKVYKDDIELGTACMGTDVSGDDEGRAYIFEMVKEHGMIEEAIEEAKAAIDKLTEA